jgi:hypothetical protein
MKARVLCISFKDLVWKLCLGPIHIREQVSALVTLAYLPSPTFQGKVAMAGISAVMSASV